MTSCDPSSTQSMRGSRIDSTCADSEESCSLRAQRALLAQSGFAIGAVELDEIEKAGGSLRCCVAEIF